MKIFSYATMCVLLSNSLLFCNGRDDLEQGKNKITPPTSHYVPSSENSSDAGDAGFAPSCEESMANDIALAARRDAYDKKQRALHKRYSAQT